MSVGDFVKNDNVGTVAYVFLTSENKSFVKVLHGSFGLDTGKIMEIMSDQENSWRNLSSDELKYYV